MPYEAEDEDKDFVKSYQESSIHLADGRFSAKLPWKPSHPPLPTNKTIASGRNRSTPEQLRMYADIFAEQEKRGFIKVTDRIQSRTNAITCPTMQF